MKRRSFAAPTAWRRRKAFPGPFHSLRAPSTYVMAAGRSIWLWPVTIEMKATRKRLTNWRARDGRWPASEFYRVTCAGTGAHSVLPAMLFYRKLMQAAAFAMALLSLLVVSAPGVAQQITTQTAVPRQITGQVKLGDKPAPAGVPVVLQMVFTGEKDSGSQVGQTITNAEGKFAFDRLELVGKNHGRNFFAVSAIQPGFEGAIEVVDLTSETHGEANLNLRRSVEGSSGNAEKPQEPSQQGRFSS